MTDHATLELIEQCRDALAEELTQWGTHPSVDHVKQAHDKCVEWLSHAAIAQPVQQATALGFSEFIRKTNEDYSAWCGSYYDAAVLDERGMMSLHGLWAWQEQERRKVCAPIAQPVQPAKVPFTDEPISDWDEFAREIECANRVKEIK